MKGIVVSSLLIALIIMSGLVVGMFGFYNSLLTLNSPVTPSENITMLNKTAEVQDTIDAIKTRIEANQTNPIIDLANLMFIGFDAIKLSFQSMDMLANLPAEVIQTTGGIIPNWVSVTTYVVIIIIILFVVISALMKWRL